MIRRVVHVISCLTRRCLLSNKWKLLLLLLLLLSLRSCLLVVEGTHVTAATASRVIVMASSGCLDILGEECVNQFFHGLGSRSNSACRHGLAEVPHHHHGARGELLAILTTEPRSLLSARAG